MREIRDIVMQERVAFIRAFDTYPSHLFASPEWSEMVGNRFGLENGGVYRPIHGMRFYDMLIHVVPSLPRYPRGFYVA
jgi:hypothetical protein